jgi:hypothetical protein
MELANATLYIGNESTVPLKSITPAQARVLVAMHSDRAKKIALTDIEVIGKAATVEIPGRDTEYDKDGKIITQALAPKLRDRFDLEELARLRTLYHKTRIEEVFPKGTLKLPQTFAEAAEAWKPVPVVEQGKVGNWSDTPLPMKNEKSPITKMGDDKK